MGTGKVLSVSVPILEMIFLPSDSKIIFRLYILIGRFLQSLCNGQRTRGSNPIFFKAMGKLPTTSPNPPVLAKGLISGLTKSIFMVDKKRNNSTFDVRIEGIGKQLEALNHSLHS